MEEERASEVDAPTFNHNLDARQVELLLQGCDLFDQGLFWEAHEAWEDLWKGLKVEQRWLEADGVQGMIQCAALLHNYERRKQRGVVRMHEKLAPRLDSVKPLLFDIDVDDLLASVTSFRDAAASEPPDWELDTRMVRLDRRGL